MLNYADHAKKLAAEKLSVGAGRVVTGVYANEGEKEKRARKKRARSLTKSSTAVDTPNGRADRKGSAHRHTREGTMKKKTGSKRRHGKAKAKAGAGNLTGKAFLEKMAAAKAAKAAGRSKGSRKAKASAGAAAVPAATGVGKKMSAKAKRSRAAKRAAATRAENHERRSRAAKKGARKRARHGAGSAAVAAGAGKKSSKKHKGGKKHGKRAGAGKLTFPESRRENGRFRSDTTKSGRAKGYHTQTQAAKRLRADIKELRRRHAKYRREHGMRLHSRENPIAPIDYAAAVGGGTVGLVGFFMIDAIIATNPVAASTGTNSATNPVPGWTETPSTGKTYNIVATATPIWSTTGKAGFSGSVPWRLVAAGLEIVGPWAVTMIPVVNKIDPLTTGLRVLSLGAGLGTAFKLVKDMGAKFLGNTAIGQRLFQTEISARAMYLDVKAAAAATPAQMLPPNTIAPPVTTGTVADLTASGITLVGAAGYKRVQRGHARHKQLGAGAGCCGNCAQGLPCAKELPDSSTVDTGAGRASPPPRTSPPRVAAVASKSRYANHWSSIED